MAVADIWVTSLLTFQKYAVRERPSAEAIAEIRHDLADIAGAEIKVEKEQEGPPTGAAVTIRLAGEDFKTLEDISERAKNAISNVPGLVNLRSDHEAARPELAFIVDRRRAMLLGVNTATVGNFLKTAVFGSEVGKYRQYNDEYDITVRLPLSPTRKRGRSPSSASAQRGWRRGPSEFPWGVHLCRRLRNHQASGSETGYHTDR